MKTATTFRNKLSCSDVLTTTAMNISFTAKPAAETASEH